MAAGRHLHGIYKEETIEGGILFHLLNEITLCSEIARSVYYYKETHDNVLNKERCLVVYYQTIFRLAVGIT